MLVIISLQRRIAEQRIKLMDQRRGPPVTTMQAVIFGMMLSWSPCVLLMAYLLWRAPLEPD
jgi:hypothetical protein